MPRPGRCGHPDALAGLGGHDRLWLARIICDDPKGAVAAISEAGFTANLTKVVAVEVPDVPGGLADVLDVLDAAGLNIEYSYCFADAREGATVAFKVDEAAIGALEGAGFKVLHPEDLYKTVR